MGKKFIFACDGGAVSRKGEGNTAFPSCFSGKQNCLSRSIKNYVVRDMGSERT
jgi:hypothetical protein